MQATTAVVRGLRTHLTGLGPGTTGAQQDLADLLVVADELLHRAGLDDTAGARRDPDSVAALRRGCRDLGDRPDPAAVDRLADLVDRLRAADLAGLPAADTLHVPDGGGGRPGTSTTELAAYLRSRGDHRTLRSSTVLTGGFSKETVLLVLDGPDGAEEVALRKVAAGRAAGTLADEYRVLEFAAAHGIAVAPPLWLDTGPNALGSPLFASRRMPGRTVGTVSGPAAGATPDVARELAGLLAALHTVDVTDLHTTPRPASASRADVLARIDEREKILHEVADALPDTPGLELHAALLGWLRAHLPPLDRPPVLVHGDVGFHNLLVADGRVSALLDWEMAHRGHPAEDLAYVRPAVEQLLGWDEFVDLYTRAGGPRPGPAELRFFAVWQDTWRASSCLRLRTKFLLDPARLSDGVSGLLLTARFLHDALQHAFPPGVPG